MQTSHIVFALALGLVPALFWLWFWLREDRAHPEPKALIASAFLAGMAAVLLVLPLQQFALSRFAGSELTLAWVIIEETLKYAAALIVVLWHKAVDEPIDAVIYMIAIALGFSALENALFVFGPLLEGNILQSALTGQFRFLGATLVHVLASGTVGVAMALSFYKHRGVRVLYAAVGLSLAIVLHALFNFSILKTSGETLLGIFAFVWLGVIALFLVFEKIKRITKPRRF